MQKKYHIITIGCQMNKSDSERTASYLDDLGYRNSKKREKADWVILTSCGVRQSAEDRLYGLVPQIKKDNPNVKIIITGCLAERADVIKRLKDKVDIWLPIVKLPSLAKLLKEDNKKITSYKDYLSIKPKYESKTSAFVPIGNGCDNFCTYCVVPYARGREVYRNPEEIYNEVRGLVKNGYKEITLIAQNVNSYKFSIFNPPAVRTGFKFQFNFKFFNDSKNINFAGLLELINSIEGDFLIRFATSHPKDMSDELIDVIANCEKISKHIHLPAQSGDDEILKRMNRKYTRADYLKLIKKIKKKIPNCSITTDIIVGFPGETKAQFKNTAKLFKEVGFAMAYIAQYSPRYGTAAFKLKDNISRDEKKRREKELMEILEKTKLKNNKNSRKIATFTRGKKVICVVGPTASGKTGLAVKLAEHYNGEIISADSRQVYKYTDVVTGKDLSEYKNTPYYLIDVASPNTVFDLAKFIKKASIAIKDIQRRGKVPIICGGTGLYAQALVDGYDLGTIKADKILRKKLEEKTISQLLAQLKKLDTKKYNNLNNSEKNNKRHLIRYIEISKKTDSRKQIAENKITAKNKYLVIGVKRYREETKKLIYKRLIERLEKEDMIGEVERMHSKHKVSWKRMRELGLEYPIIIDCLQKKIDYDEMVVKLNIAERQFAKRQMTWYRRWETQGQKIHWTKDYTEAKKSVDKFLIRNIRI